VSIGGDGIIPSFDATNTLYNEIGDEAYRDAGHVPYGVGRYMLACVWYMSIFGKNIIKSYGDFDVDVSEERVLLAKTIAKESVLKNVYKLT